MAVNIAINGYGRIGRNVLRALYEGGRRKELRIVAINDLGDAATNAHLTRFDTAHGPFPFDVKVDGSDLVIDGDRIQVCAERNPADLPWGKLGVDVVLECTGFFASKEKASAHLSLGFLLGAQQRTNQAKGHFQTFLQLAPLHPKRKQIQAILKQR